MIAMSVLPTHRITQMLQAGCCETSLHLYGTAGNCKRCKSYAIVMFSQGAMQAEAFQ